MRLLGIVCSSAAGTVSCTTDGEIIQFLDPLNIKLFTLFDFGRYDYPPTIQLYDSTRTIPAAVSVLSSVKSNVGWYFGIKGKTVHTPAQMEVICELPFPGLILLMQETDM